MKDSQRVIVNTFAQYARTIINMGLSLYTVRVVLLALGESDYGIYSVVAGVVSMLAFVTNSLVTTTQRFISFYQGAGNKETVRDVLNNSMIIHIILGVIVVLALEAIAPYLFNGFLNIPSERIEAASIVFQTVIIMLFLSFITSPFRALLISHENIVYISIIDVLDGILKVVFAILLTNTSIDKLVFYGFMMCGVQLFNFLTLSGYCYYKYEECGLPRFGNISKGYVREMITFAGWSVYSTGCIVGRQQGVAIVINRYLGAAINAAYGIAFQIAGYASFLSSALVNAIAPQIVKAEGAGNRGKALSLSTITCKMMFFLLSAVCVPFIFEMEDILQWWLKDAPEYAGLFCCMVLLTSMADNLTIGLVHINQAIGKIGAYSLFINTPKLLSVPLVIACLYFGENLYVIAVVYITVELVCSLARLPFISKTAGLNISRFVKDAIAPIIIPTFLNVIVCFLMVNYLDFPYRFIVTFIISFTIYMCAIYLCGLTKKEKEFVIENVKKIIKK